MTNTRLEEIRAHHCPMTNRECPTPKWQMREDIDYLLSLLDARPAVVGRLVNVNAHGGPTRERLREIEASVSNGYESEYRELGWSKALQSQLRDLHFLLTFFHEGDSRKIEASAEAQFEAWLNRYWPDWRKASQDTVELMQAAWIAAIGSETAPAVAADARELVEQIKRDSKHAPVSDEEIIRRITTYGEQRWREGMERGAREVCDTCENSARYGPAHKIKGSTRYWHVSDEGQFPCEAGGIWHALNHPADKVVGE